MAGRDLTGEWHVRVIRPRLPWASAIPRAAEVANALGDMMLAKEYSLEDADYQKVVPNEYRIELEEGNYLRNFQPIEARLKGQWRARLLEQLALANSRLGRKVYNLGAPIRLEIEPAADLSPSQMRISCRVAARAGGYPGESRAGRPAAQSGPAGPRACLELAPSGRRWLLGPGVITIGRHPEADIFLDFPEVQERRLVSGQHAHLRSEGGVYTLFDGSPEGRASVNGTYVNGQLVRAAGRRLVDGDTILLAALDPLDPRPDVPGVVVLRFREGCPG
jgi:hypothetical protein